MAEIDRRGFLALTAGVCAACALGGNVLAADTAAAAGPIDVGALADFKADGITSTFARSGFLLIRHDGKLYATSNVCTHKGAQVINKNGELVCPKHDSHFSLEGTVTKGKANSTLPRYAISVDDKGHVMVDKGTEFNEKKFEDKKAFVAIPK
jgi:nitrite reductase/ring-hydroxylating ferredoxin subunit